MSRIAIVVIAFNREKSLARLLDSLYKAEYLNEKIDLIISIDFNKNNLVYELADSFKWPYGQKEVIKHSINLGLRKHVIFCGDLSQKYENVIILEDDLYVSNGFFNFSKQAIDYYKVNELDNIVGISLYSQSYNENCKRPFKPIKGNSDVYFMQLPSSWGQIWSKSQWIEFKEWYIKNNINGIDINSGLPENIVKWPESSWKKYFIKYMYDKNKFFVYPYDSLSTNFGDIGTHFRATTKALQVNISCFESKKIYNFSNIEENMGVYDVYMENIKLEKFIEEKFGRRVTIDLYGTKKNINSDLLLTNRNIDKKIIREYDLSLRPHEMNIFENIDGSYFKLYDYKIDKKNRLNVENYNEITYDLFTLNRISVAIKFIVGRLKIYLKYFINNKIFK